MKPGAMKPDEAGVLKPEDRPLVRQLRLSGDLAAEVRLGLEAAARRKKRPGEIRVELRDVDGTKWLHAPARIVLLEQSEDKRGSVLRIEVELAVLVGEAQERKPRTNGRARGNGSSRCASHGEGGASQKSEP